MQPVRLPSSCSTTQQASSRCLPTLASKALPNTSASSARAASRTCARQATGRELAGDVVESLGAIQSLRERAGKNHDRVDARQLEVDRLAGFVGRGFEFEPGRSAAGVAGRPDTRVGNEPLAVLVA